MTREELIKAVEEKYGDKYDCSSATDQFVRQNSMVPVMCKKHGMFYITPYQLLNGMVQCFECFKDKYLKK
jgi:hypothetical protein